MLSNGRVFRPQGALMVFPCIGSVIQVTICPAWRTARIRWGNLTLMFSAPILVITVILPGLFVGFSISISFTKSLGFILSLTCRPFFLWWEHVVTVFCFVNEKLVFNSPWCQEGWQYPWGTQHGHHQAGEFAHQPRACGQSNRRKDQRWSLDGLKLARKVGGGTHVRSRTQSSSSKGGPVLGQLQTWSRGLHQPDVPIHGTYSIPTLVTWSHQ